MSFSEKIASIMERPGQDPSDKDDVPWWLKYGGRALGTAGGFLAIFVGAFNVACIVFAMINSFLSGICLMLAGFLVITVEAPCCCMFLDFVQSFSNMVEKRPYWNRAAAYLLLAIPPILFDFSMAIFFASGLIFGTGVLYGMMSIGKKAPISDMRTTAVDITVPSSSMKNNLVENAQPISFSIKPDSNV